MDEIRKLSGLNEKQVDKAVSICIDGLYNLFSAVSKDKEKLHRLLKNSFDYDMTYAYLQDGEAVGFLGLGNHLKRPIKLSKEIFMDIKGGFAGEVAYKAMSKAMEKLNINSPHEVLIEYIATNPEHRCKGIGSKFIEFICHDLSYKAIELEVFSKNPRAIKFYERKGFQIVSKKADFMMMIQGNGRRILMRLETE